MNQLTITLLCSSYVLIGLQIGLVEAGGPAFSKSNFCREHPVLHIIMQAFLWPILFIFINNTYALQKTIKLLMVFVCVYFIQHFIFDFANNMINALFSCIISFIITFFITPLLFGVFRMPGLPLPTNFNE